MPRTHVDGGWFINSMNTVILFEPERWRWRPAGQVLNGRNCLNWVRDNAMSVLWCFCPGRLVRAGCSRRFTCSHRVGCCGWPAGVWCHGRSRQFSDIHGIVSYQDVLPDLQLNHLSGWNCLMCVILVRAWILDSCLVSYALQPVSESVGEEVWGKSPRSKYFSRYDLVFTELRDNI